MMLVTRIFSSKKLLVAAALAAVALLIASAAYRKQHQTVQETPKIEQQIKQPKVKKTRKPQSKVSKQRRAQQSSQPGWRRGCDANGMCWWYWE